MLSILLRPGRALAARLNFSAKLLLLVLIFCIPLVFLMWTDWTAQRTAVEFSSKEREGLRLIVPARQLMQDLQKHRGLAQIVLAGRDDQAAALAQFGARVDEDYAALGRIDEELGAVLQTRAPLARIGSDWQDLRSAATRLPAADSFRRHSELVANLLAYVSVVADQSNLTLDPDLDSYYTMDATTTRIPAMAEAAAQLRGLASGIAARRAMTVEERVRINVLLQTYDDNLDALQSGLGKVFGANAVSRAALEPSLRNLRTSGAQLHGQIRSQILDATVIRVDSKEVFDDASRAVDSAYALFDACAPELDRLLAARLQSIRDDGRRRLVVVGLAIGIAAYLFLALRSLIVEGMRRLVEGAQRLATGDFSAAVPVLSRDEIGRLAGSLNEIRAQLGEKIAAERLAAEQMLRVRIALDNASTGVMIADSAHHVVYVNAAAQRMLQQAATGLRLRQPDFDAACLVGTDMERLLGAGESAGMPPLGAATGQTADLQLGDRHIAVSVNAVIAESGARIGDVAELRDRTVEHQTQNEIGELVRAAAAGHFDRRIGLDGKDGFFRDLALGLNALVETTDRGLGDVARLLDAVAAGDLTRTIAADYQGAFGQIKAGANSTVGQLKEVVARIKESAESIDVAAKEIAAGNLDLSTRTEQQASSLEETSGSMEQLNVTVKRNASNAGQANDLARASNSAAVEGGRIVTAVVQTMSGMRESSRRIADIVGVIDDIAFQTNILALNAAVEAARAGTQGQGFAVVASEVRKLAQRSATAAKEIRELIADSVGRVDAATRLADEAGRTTDEVVTSFRRVSELVTGIADASREQSVGIDQVTVAVGQMDEVTQRNAALVEQAAAAAARLEQEAHQLVETVAGFRLA